MSDLAVQNRESEQEVMPSFDFLLERETERNTLLAEHRAWLKEIKRERPLPKTHYRVAVSVRNSVSTGRRNPKCSKKVGKIPAV